PHPLTPLSVRLTSVTPRSTLFPYTTLFRSVLAAPSRETQHRPVRRTVAGPTEALGIDEGFHKIDGMTIGPFPLSGKHAGHARQRSEEHTSELQSPDHIVCRLLLEKKHYKEK